MGFQERRHFFSQKMAKIADSIDHTIDTLGRFLKIELRRSYA
jgi:hypothetical protein